MAMILPTVQENIAPAGAYKELNVPELKNYSGEQLQAFGAAQQKFGQELSNIGQEQQRQVNIAVLNDGDNKLAEHIRAVDDNYRRTQNAETITARPQAEKAIRDKIVELGKGLTDVQKMAFNKVASARLNSFLGSADEYERAQSHNYFIKTTSDRTKSFVIDAIRAKLEGNEEGFRNSKSSALMEVDNFAGMSGIPAKDDNGNDNPTYLALRKDVNTEIHTGVLNKLIDSYEMQKAKDYYDQYKGEIDPTKDAMLEHKILDGMAYIDGKALGQKIYAEKMTGTNVNNAVPEDVMIKEIQADTSLNERAKDYAIKEVKAQTALREAQIQRYVHEASNTVFGMINGNQGYGTVVNKIKQLQGVIPESAISNLLSVADTKYHISEDRQADRQAAKFQQSLNNLGKLLTFQNDYTAGKYGKLNPADIAKNYMGAFGTHTDDAARFVQHANDMAGQAQVHMDDLKNELRIMKQNPALKKSLLIPDPDGNSPADKANMALLQNKVMGIISASGKANGPGRQITVQQALQQVLQPVTSGKGFFYDSKTPVYKLGTTDAADISKWSKEARAAYINSQFYTTYGRMPSKTEFQALETELNK